VCEAEESSQSQIETHREHHELGDRSRGEWMEGGAFDKDVQDVQAKKVKGGNADIVVVGC
jgi:hypothetical protein